MAGPKPRLGRGLDALLPAPGAAAAPTRQNFLVPIEQVHPNPEQPRGRFVEEALEELAQSIRSLGVLEPILVRNRPAGGYEIIAGERRWRAAQRAGLHEVPVFVRELSEKEAFEAALVENLQREDLNPIETGRAFHRLMEEHGHTQESLAALIGKDRSTVANAMRLLKLPPDVLGEIEAGRLSEGHGRALLGAADVPTMQRLARMAIAKNLSVREVERLARASHPTAVKRDAEPKEKSANVRDLETRLSRSLGTTVKIEESSKGRGKLVLHYASYDELDRLLAELM